ncbi:TonB-dependent receptor [Microbulbifer sp.]|uniref:TonB-dependent receptor n=1 Tax=Microbulbifer sp. TaxID=1908541 RepID=UPI003F3C682E
MRKGALVAGLLLLFSGSSLTAAENRLETVTVTGTRYEQPLRDHAGSLSLLSDSSLELVSHTHIQQSLVRIPGADFARGNGQEYLPSLRSPVLSGAGACGGLLTAEDGIPLRAAGFCNINELFESGSEIAQRIEVVRGPAGTLYGSNAMHGVINVIGPRVEENRGFSIGLEGGPHDYVRTSISANSGRSGSHALRADLSLAGDGGYRDASGFDQQKLRLAHRHDGDNLSVTTRLAATNLNQETAGYVEGEGVYRNGRLSRTNPNPEAFRDARALRLSSQVEMDLEEGARLSLTPYLRKTEMEFLQHYLPGQPLEENGQRSAGIRASYRTDPRAPWQLIAGLDAEYTHAFLLERQDIPTQGSDFLRETIPVGKHYDYRVDALMAAPFVLANWQVNNSLALNAGLRYEVMVYDYDNHMLAGRTAEDGTPCDFGGCRFSRPEDREDRFENWSPKIGGIYQLAENRQLFFNLAHGFRAPQATELYRLQRRQTVAELDPEKIASVEIGLRGEGEKLGYELVAYAMRKDNVIFRDADFFNQSNGETKHRGVELALDYALAEDWQLAISASYAEHRYRDDRLLDGISIENNLMDSAPRHFGSSRLLWQPTAQLHAELEWLHRGSYYTDPQNLHRYPGHDLLNLRTRFQLDERWALSARLINLTDEAYAERADYSSFSGDRYFPGEPRALYLEIQADLL